MATLLERTDSNDAAIYSDPRFLNSLQLHMPYINTPENVALIDVDRSTAAAFRGDFFGLLAALKVPSRYRYAMALVNEVWDSSMFDGNMTQIKIMSDKTIDDLAAKMNSVNK